jgi:phosphopantothenoylcysteine decarboxylase / phosphopantothenate---cysteine ligase
MISKNCDMLVGNLVGEDRLGFGSDQNEVEIVTRFGRAIHAGPADKTEIAERILDEIANLRLSLRGMDRSA